MNETYVVKGKEVAEEVYYNEFNHHKLKYGAVIIKTCWNKEKTGVLFELIEPARIDKN